MKAEGAYRLAQVQKPPLRQVAVAIADQRLRDDFKIGGETKPVLRELSKDSKIKTAAA